MVQSIKLNEVIQVRGCITLDKYLRGRSLEQIEKTLGFHQGRLRDGMAVAALLRYPSKHEFVLQGYNQVASHHFDKRLLQGLAVPKLKNILRSQVWSLQGPNRLVKVIPFIQHDPNLEDDLQYPPGWGVPQWVITKPYSVDALIISLVNNYPFERYQ